MSQLPVGHKYCGCGCGKSFDPEATTNGIIRKYAHPSCRRRAYENSAREQRLAVQPTSAGPVRTVLRVEYASESGLRTTKVRTHVPNPKLGIFNL